jgi:hypothetical protein
LGCGAAEGPCSHPISRAAKAWCSRRHGEARLAPAAPAAAMDDDYVDELQRCSSDPLGDNTQRGLHGGLDAPPELRRWHSMSQLALLEKAVYEVEDRCVARAPGAGSAIFNVGRTAVQPCRLPAASCSPRCSGHPSPTCSAVLLRLGSPCVRRGERVHCAGWRSHTCVARALSRCRGRGEQVPGGEGDGGRGRCGTHVRV